MATEPLLLLGIAGSLRSGSLNRALLRSVVELTPISVNLKIFDLAGIPLYNGDLDTDDRRPAPVTALKSAISSANGLLLASPEYNYGVPGVLKNALDWASRPGFRSPMANRPTGLIGASTGAGGTMRGQEQIKLNLLGMGAQVFPHPGVAVTRAEERFDEDLRLSDEKTREFVKKYLTSFSEWVRKVKTLN